MGPEAATVSSGGIRLLGDRPGAVGEGVGRVGDHRVVGVALGVGDRQRSGHREWYVLVVVNLQEDCEPLFPGASRRWAGVSPTR